MAGYSPSPEKSHSRKLKVHKKSRRGCGNCKLRKVKCDEARPKCKKCVAYGVLCNYDSQCPDLQLSATGASNIVIPLRFTSLDQSIPSLFVPSLSQQWAGAQDTSFFYQSGGQAPDLLGKFQTETVVTIGAPKARKVFRDNIVRLAYSHPYLMHTVLALTLMHNRSSSPTPHSTMSATEAFHFYQGTTLFKKRLSGPINPSERDALFFSSLLLSIVTFYYVEACTPEEAWPLKPSSALDLNWIAMTNGKAEIWRVTKTAGRVPSVFDNLPKDNLVTFAPSPSLEALPPSFIALFGLDDPTSSPATNPYHFTATALAQFLPIACPETTLLAFISYTADIDSGIRRLLHMKDARALLLIAYWYALVCQMRIWWISKRTAIECQAICLYLERYHSQNSTIQELLRFPQQMCENGVIG